MMTELPYLRIEVEEYETPFGYNVVSNLKAYSGVSIRNNVIQRIDIISSMSGCFTDENLEKYRSQIFKIMSGEFTDKDSICKVLTHFYRTDKVFNKFVSTNYYFGSSAGKTLYGIIIEAFKDKYLEAYNKAYELLRGNYYKVICESEGYLYFATPDRMDFIVAVPAGYKEETISYAKSWKGEYNCIKL